MKRSFPLPTPAKSRRAKKDSRNLAWVQCRDYRCIAYQNSEGKWINFYTDKKLADFVEVIG
jgi:hypothetical protein